MYHHYAKTALAVLLAASMALLGSACGRNAVQEEASSLPVSSSEPVVEEPQGNQNPLTGLYDLPEDMVGKRPISVMINNHHASWPQRGISLADIIYEVPVEGGLTRLMAVYADYGEVPEFGSVRSVRHDFVELSMPFDTIFIHWGGSDAGYQSLWNHHVDDLDGMAYGTTYFYTDRSLGKSVEHTRFMTQENLQDALKNLDFPLEGETPEAYSFAEEEDPVSYPEAGTGVSFAFSGSVKSAFAYDTAAGDYTKTEYGEPVIDGTTGQPVHIKNVFLLYDSVPLMSDGLHVDLSLSSGEGWYLTNGTRTAIRWSKGDADAPLTFTDANGGTLTVNPGNSWVSFIPNNMSGNTTFTGETTA